jgi:HSP20 family protein
MNVRDLVPWRREKDKTAMQRKGVDRTRALQANINQAFDDFWRGFGIPAPFEGVFGDRLGALGDGVPRIDVRENEKEVDVEVELPGMDEKDIDVSVAEGTLVIRGEKKAQREEKDRGYIRRERSFGRIERVVPLPDGLDLDDAKAMFKNGVLTVAIPRTREAQDAVKHISVRSA